MAIDPSIALQGRVANIGDLVQNFAANEQAMKRQEKADARADESFDLQKQEIEQRRAEYQRKIREAGKEQSVKDHAVMVSRLVGANAADAERILTNRIADLDARAANGENVNADDSRAMLQMLKENPGAYQAEVLREHRIAQETGYLKPAQDTRTSAEKNYDAAVSGGFSGSFLDYQTALKRAGASNTTISTKQETEYQKQRGKDFAKMANDIDTASNDAQRTINQISRMRSLLEKAPQGAGAETSTAIKRAMLPVAKMFGVEIDEDKLASAEGVQSLAQDMLAAVIARSKGSTSDVEFAEFGKAIPGLSKTAKGNAIILETMEEVAKRDREVAKLARAYETKNGQIDGGFMAELQRWQESNPLFTDAKRKEIEAAQKASASTASATFPVDPTRPVVKRNGWSMEIVQ